MPPSVPDVPDVPDVPSVPDEGSLYALAPEDFTAARNALVKRLKQAGEKERAAAAAKLRRPALTAWALNQVARHQPDLVAAVFDAGDALRDAMDAAVSGDASGVRAAQAAERDAVEAAVDAALTHLSSQGGAASEDARWRMSQTLRAALVDEGAAAHLRAGTMDVDIEASGFGTFGFGDVISAPGRAKKKAPEPAPAAPPAPTKAAKKAGKKAGKERSLSAVPDLPASEDGDDDAEAEAAAAAAAAQEEARRAARDRAAMLEAGAERLAEDAARLQAAADDATARAAERRAAAEQAEQDAQAATTAAADAARLATSARTEADAARAAADAIP